MSTTDSQMLRYIPDEQMHDKIINIPECIVSKKVLKLLFSQQYKQRTEEWYEKRKQNNLTASDCASAIDLNKYQSRNELIRKKSGFFTSKTDYSNCPAIQHGVKYEDEAADIYMCQNPHLAPFFEIGLIMHDKHPFLGASPDRVTKDGILIEIKVPFLLIYNLFISIYLNCCSPDQSFSFLKF